MATITTLAQTSNTATPFGTGQFTTGSFTPPNNSLLLVGAGSMWNGGPGSVAAPNITDSLTAHLTYTQIDRGNLTPSFGTQMTWFRAPVTTGASMTVSVQDPGGKDIFGWQVIVLSIDPYNTSTPINGTVTSGTADIGDGSESLTLSASPASGDYTFVALHEDCTALDANPSFGGEWAEVGVIGTTGGGGTMHAFRRTASTSTSVTCTDVYTAAGTFFKGTMLAFTVQAATASALTGSSVIAEVVGITSTGIPTRKGASVIAEVAGVTTSGHSVQAALVFADSVDGSWTDQGGGTNLTAAIDEATANTSDYIRSELTPQDSGCRVKLATLGVPSSTSNHFVRWSIAKDVASGDTINMTVKLYQGGGNSQGAGTLIASFSRNNVSETFTTYSETLSSGQVASISDYTDLYLEFFADTA